MQKAALAMPVAHNRKDQLVTNTLNTELLLLCREPVQIYSYRRGSPSVTSVSFASSPRLK